MPKTFWVYPGGKPFELPDSPMTKGGTADIYKLPSGKYLAKLPRSDLITEVWCEKAVALVDHYPTFASQVVPGALPMKLVLDEHREVVGILMQNLVDYLPIEFLYSPAIRLKLCPEFSSRDAAIMAIRVATAVSWFHERGILPADISGKNVLFHRQTGEIKLIDLDGAQVSLSGKTYEAEGATPEYTPPELLALDSFAGIQRSASQDVFSTLIIMTQLLRGSGDHLFAGKWDRSDGSSSLPLEARILGNAWPGSKVGPYVGKVMEPAKSVSLNSFGTEMVECCRRVLDDGFQDASNRPALKELITSTLQYTKHQTCCQENPRHYYLASLAECPFCAVRRRSHGMDPFPRPEHDPYARDKRGFSEAWIWDAYGAATD